MLDIYFEAAQRIYPQDKCLVFIFSEQKTNLLEVTEVCDPSRLKGSRVPLQLVMSCYSDDQVCGTYSYQ